MDVYMNSGLHIDVCWTCKCRLMPTGIRHNSDKAYKSLKTGVHGKYILGSSRAKFTRLLFLRLMLI